MPSMLIQRIVASNPTNRFSGKYDEDHLLVVQYAAHVMYLYNVMH